VTERIITTDALDKLIAEWSKRAAVYAPVTRSVIPRSQTTRDLLSWTEYRRITSAAEVCFDRVNTKVSAKALLFPKSEALLRFSSADPADAQESEPVAEQVVLGVRPCDAAAIAVLDKFFSQGQPDSYYQRRRERTTLVGIACNKPADTCFCTSVGGSPFGTRGLDLLLTDLGGRYLAEPVTEKGAALIASMPDPAIGDLQQRKDLAEQSLEPMPKPIDTTGLKRRLDSGFDSPVWEELSLPCVNCAACTFLCPTCHCFDITDEERKGRGARIRVWDSCQFCQYSQHASGHNPRAATQTRYRNRVMDKFKYTVDMIGELSCVGCGRCVAECPANIDVRETVGLLLERLSDKQG
jgi:ferredoxin